ncbi:hypothetical protein QWZ08_13190 [Ferruginibacter paludis]|uniref:hypothetical protein n=1 Tax=Ferruginibacter paludis TaxID=1310417 RepID=UPI0025B45DEA|nr:hypothetical protein [Ferruginibacter paludis]MDN3656594.1 hypothetical protein [Ferruginibacter paludis]
MFIEVNDTTSLRQIQEVFSDFYPYLKLAFYGKGHKKYQASNEGGEIEPNTLIGEIKATHVSGVIEMLPLYKVADVEKEFQQRFGLSVQVLRKEKKGWEQTTGMDDFTLKELNELGRNSSDEFIMNEDVRNDLEY